LPSGTGGRRGSDKNGEAHKNTKGKRHSGRGIQGGTTLSEYVIERNGIRHGHIGFPVRAIINPASLAFCFFVASMIGATIF
jgi:hypothetical protein